MKRDRLREIILRLERLETAVFGTHPKRDPKKARKGRQGNALPTRILKLRDQGLFKEPQTASEVHGKLQSQYRCEPDRVATALLRLQRSKKLRKSSKVVGKKKHVAYAW